MTLDKWLTDMQCKYNLHQANTLAHWYLLQVKHCTDV